MNVSQKNCPYRSCVTTDGYPCIFPFKYKNVTLEGLETELTYTKCSTVGLFVPWCPTGNYDFSIPSYHTPHLK